MAALNNSKGNDDDTSIWIFFDDSNVWIEAKLLGDYVLFEFVVYLINV